MGRRMAQAYIEQGPAKGNLMMEQFDTVASSLIEQVEPFVAEQVQAIEAGLREASAKIALAL